MSDYRYELKFVLTNNELNLLDSFLKINKFKNVYPRRMVNSIYFDTNEFTSIKENLSGIANRDKVRLRWYGNNSSIPQLELKKKRGRIGTKNNYKIEHLKDLNLDMLTSRQIHKTTFSYLKENRKDLIIDKYYTPIVYIGYERDYFELEEGIRLTIDKKIHFKHLIIDRPVNKIKKINHNKIVVELKFGLKKIDHIKNLIKKSGLVPERHSKYLYGVTRLGLASYI